MTQLEIPLSRNSDPVTSHVAAARSATFRASHEAKIYDVISRASSGLTYRAVAAMTGMEPVAVARRLVAMERRRLITRRCIEDTGRYLTRDGMALWWKR